MNKNLELIEEEFIYVTEVRYHRQNYPYRLAVEEKETELIIHHQSRNKEDKEKWTTTHSIGIKKRDLDKILENIK